MRGINYTLENKIDPLSEGEKDIIEKAPPLTSTDWSKDSYNVIKQRIKGELLLHQFDRCAYCRKELEAAGKYEPLEHIVPKTEKPTWMLIPKNLALCCDRCNNLKNDNKILAPTFEADTILPEISEAYLIFHPHFDNWGDHFEFEEDIFIVAKTDDKGKQTIKSCQLYRFNVIINRAKELRMNQKQPMYLISKRMKMLYGTNNLNSAALFSELTNALDHFIARVQDDDHYN